jgi:hypothetical protein
MAAVHSLALNCNNVFIRILMASSYGVPVPAVLEGHDIAFFGLFAEEQGLTR